VSEKICVRVAKQRKNKVSSNEPKSDNVPVPFGSGNSRRLIVLAVLFALCVIFYYFGEIVKLLGWDFLSWQFFYTVHDTHRLFYLAPIVYAGYFFGTRAGVIVTIVSAFSFLPRAVFISPYPDPLLRMVLFVIIAGVIGYISGVAKDEYVRLKCLTRALQNERDRLLEVLQRIEDGVLITAPDYRVRFANPRMVKDFGEVAGARCYQYLHQLDSPCQQDCRLQRILSGAIECWEYRCPDGRIYKVTASPYKDSDGVVCQLATFRNITHLKKGGS
jgi:PAS domain-containing protein